MSLARVFAGLSLLGLYLAILGPLRRFAQSRGWRTGRGASVGFHRLLCAALNVRVRQHGEPAPNARRLIVANHVSWLDIPVMGSREPMTFLAKKEVGGPFLGRQIVRLQGVVFVDRARRRLIPQVNADMAAAMRRGEPTVLYAEATTGDGNRLLKFRSSHFEAVRQAQAGEAVQTIVQPVFLNYTRIAGLPATRRTRPLVAWYGDMAFWPHLWDFLHCGGVDCTVVYGEPIQVGAGDARKALARRAESAVRGLAGAARASSHAAIPAGPEKR